MELCLLHDRMLQRGMLQRAEGIIGVSKWVNSLGEKTNITEGTQNRTLGHRRAPHSGRGGYKTRAEQELYRGGERRGCDRYTYSVQRLTVNTVLSTVDSISK